MKSLPGIYNGKDTELSHDEALRLVNKLRVQQVELEMENDILRQGTVTSSAAIKGESARHDILNKIASDKPLAEILQSIASLVEFENPGSRVSILLLDNTGKKLINGACGNLPKFFTDAVQGYPIGPKSGSCGTAAFTRKRVIVEDITTSELWEEGRDIALKAGLMSCWSEPFFSATGRLIGTFAVYHSTISSPSENDIRTISHSADFAAVAVESKWANSALKAQRKDIDLLRTLVDRINDCVILVENETGLISDVNAQACKRLGYTRQELLSSNMAQIIAYRDANFTWADHVKRIRDAGSLVIENAYKRKDGTLFPVEVNISYLDQGYLLGIARDITDRKKAELELARASNLLQATQALAHVGGWELDLETREFYWTKEAYRIHETTEEEFHPTVDSVIASFAPDSAQFIKEHISKTAQTGESFDFEIKIVTAKNRDIWIQIKGHPIKKDGKTVKIEGAMQDITDRKEFERTLEYARDKALEASRLKSEFLTVMSHEIRTPLNGVIGMTNLILGTELSKQQKQMADVVRISGNNLMAIVNDILDFSKIEAGKLTINSAPFSLASLLNQTVRLLSPQAAEKSLDLKSELAPELERSVIGDEIRIQQIITNLIGNAIKFTDSGSVKVVVRPVDLGSKPIVRVEVIDTGIGIDSGHVPLIFDAFTQADGSNTRKYGGTGLGLAISKQLVELMGGHIGVQSGNTTGSTFWFEIELPFADSNSVRQTNESRRIESTGIRRILLVENSLPNQSDSFAQLSQLGHNVELAASTARAFACLSNNTFDAIFIDCGISKNDRLEILRGVREGRVFSVNQKLPIISLIDGNTPDESQDCREAGLHSHIVKPVDSRKLRDALANIEPR